MRQYYLCARATTINKLARVLMELSGRNDLRPMYVTPRKGDIRSSCADINKAKGALGCEPRILLREGLRLLVAALAAREGVPPF